MMFVRRSILSTLLVLSTFCHQGCTSAQYVGQQAIGQLHLLRIRRHVEEVLADSRTPQAVRDRLTLALAARQFGISVLGLRGGAEFTRYVDTGGPVAYNLTAADPTSLRLRRWHFPLIGTVPYLGFFERDNALQAERQLKKRGYDTYLRPVSAYSTLGYFISPIYAAMLEPEQPGPRGDVRTVEVILHEMAHSTAYIKSASELNESFATLVGIEGAARFFRERGAAAESTLVKELAAAEERQSRAFSTWLEPTLKSAGAFYERAHKESWSYEKILEQRAELFQRIMKSYRAAFPRGPSYRSLAEGPLDNAVLLSFGVYHQSSDMQRKLLDSVDGDLKSYIDLYKLAQDHADGAAWLGRMAEEHRASLP